MARRICTGQGALTCTNFGPANPPTPSKRRQGGGRRAEGFTYPRSHRIFILYLRGHALPARAPALHLEAGFSGAEC